MVNRVIIIGNLGKDPEVRHLESGTTVANFPVATSENWKDNNGEWQERTEWHYIVAWQKLAERAESSLSKGSTVYVEGKLQTDTYEKDGQKHYRTKVVASYFRIISKRDGQGTNTNTNYDNSVADAADGLPPIDDARFEKLLDAVRTGGVKDKKGVEITGSYVRDRFSLTSGQEAALDESDDDLPF